MSGQGRRTALHVELTPEERRTLTRWQRQRTLPGGVMRRARLLLLVADGLALSEVARRVGLNRPHVYTWVRRFQAEGLAGLEERPRRRRGGTNGG
jgi:hypothetical protein